MAKGKLTVKEQELLRKNLNVISVDENRIVYQNEFKKKFMRDYLRGKKPQEIFREAGLDPEVLGKKRIERATSRWKESYRAGTLGKYQDGSVRHKAAAKAKKNPKSPEQYQTELESSKEDLKYQKETYEQKLNREQRRYLDKIEKLEKSKDKQLSKKDAEIERLKAENELLKKAGWLGRRRCKEKADGRDRYEVYRLIDHIIDKYGTVNTNVSMLCKALEIPRSSYYYWKNHKESRAKREESDEEARYYIMQAYEFNRKYQRGSRGIRMTLKHDFGIIYNRKKIQRLMRKYDILCPVKRKRPYNGLWRATEEDRVAPNVLARQFKPGIRRKVLLTDITYLKNRDGFAYLSAVLDSQTNEIIAYQLSKSLKMDFVLETLAQIDVSTLADHPLMHSDQGVHYTSKDFRKSLKKMHITQSMSKRGVCHDNAPMEAFFGKLKYDMDINKTWSYEKLESEVNRYISYYDERRRQEGLHEMTPAEYSSTLIYVA